MKPIVVVNPNSTEAVTAGLDAALDDLRFHGGPPIECRTLEQGPPAIESDEDVESVAGSPVLEEPVGLGEHLRGGFLEETGAERAVDVFADEVLFGSVGELYLEIGDDLGGVHDAGLGRKVLF